MTRFEYDPTLPGFQDDPFPILAELREEHPAYYNERLRFWALSRYDDVLSASSDAKTFASSPEHYGDTLEEPTALLPRKMMDFGIFYLDPPRHDQLRALLSKAFTPRRSASLAPTVRRIARELIGGFAAKGRCELVHDFAAPLATQVIGSLLGVPAEDRWQFRLWAEKIEQRSPDVSEAQAQREQDEALSALHAYLADLVAERRKKPQDDLASALLAAEVDGLRLADHEVVGMGYQLMVAGNDTTASLISNGALRLAENPDERKKLLSTPSLLPNAVEEMVRYDSPTVQSPPRIATRDVELHGRKIPARSPVLLVWMAANHDPRRFPDPGRFDVSRELGRHLGFGHGLHFCVGANLARLETKIAFEELLGAMPDFALAGKPERWASVVLRPLGRLPLAFEAGRAEAHLAR